MLRIHQKAWLLLALTTVVVPSRGDELSGPPNATPAGATNRVYGEWRIRVKPDKGPDYNRLIEQSGLPLFREAGGRMVGWWNTLIGDLYEHVTIWEYDDMAAFERAIQFLSKSPAFARFVAARDPLLAGEESRFLRLAPAAVPPSLPEPAPFVVHEIHRVPLARKDAYLAYMADRGLGALKANGFRPLGPWVVDVGRWSEVHVSAPLSKPGRARAAGWGVVSERGCANVRRQDRRIRRGHHDPPAGARALCAQANRWRRERRSRRRRQSCPIVNSSPPASTRRAFPTTSARLTAVGSR